MNKISILIVLVVLFASSIESEAQLLSKKEKKEWKKRKKSTTLEQFKAILDERTSLRSEVASLQEENDNFSDQLASKDELINDCNKKNATIQQELTNSKNLLAKKAETQQASRKSSVPSSIDEEKGVVFKVQIGAYRNIDLPDGNSKDFGTEKGEINRYTIGVFRDYWESNKFKNTLQKMGVKDAWIVSFKDGKRVNIKEVLGNNK